jgi:hypothetical protein
MWREFLPLPACELSGLIKQNADLLKKIWTQQTPNLKAKWPRGDSLRHRKHQPVRHHSGTGVDQQLLRHKPNLFRSTGLAVDACHWDQTLNTAAPTPQWLKQLWQ